MVARHNDGTYWASFDCAESATCQPFKEHGVWGIDGGVYWVKTMLLIDHSGPFYPDTSDKRYHERYQINHIADDQFEYQNLDSHLTYRLQRVSKQFAAEFDESQVSGLY